MRRTGCFLLLSLLSALAYGQSANPTNPVAVILVDPSTGNTYNSGGSPVSSSFYPIANFTSPISVTLIDPSTGNPYKSTGAPTCTLGQLVYYASSGATFSCLTLGTNLTLSGSTLNASSTAATAFSALTGSTNTTAAMLVGTGASLGYTGSGVVDANEINGLTFPSLVSSDCLTNNGTVLSWGTCGSGGSTTFQVNSTGLASSSTVNFENSAATDGLTLSFSNPSAGNVQLGLSGALTNAGLANPATTVNTETCTLGSTCTIPFDINSSALTSQAGLNFITSTTNSVGLTATPSNPGTNEVKWEITGSSYTGNAATASALAATPSQCSGAEFATGVAANGNANCSTPSGSGITLQTNGTNNSSQTALNIESGAGTVASNPSGSNVEISVYAAQITYSASTESLTCSTINAALLTNTASGTATWTLPTTGTTGCGVGFSFDVQNTSSSTLTVSSSSDINGSGSLSIPANAGCSITTDNGGSTYDVSACTALVSGGGSGTVNNCASADYVAYYASSGTAVSCEQYVVAAQFPALGGDLSGTNGSLSVTVVKVNGAAVPASAAAICSNGSSQLTTCSTTGSGAVVLATSPTLTTPALGTPSAINLTNATAASLPVASIAAIANNTVLCNTSGSSASPSACTTTTYSAPLPGNVFVTTAYTNATTSYTSILAMGSVAASTTLYGDCDIIWEGSATALTPTFAFELSQTPTDLWVGATYNNGAFVVPTYTAISSTTQTAITPALTTTTATTAYVIHLTFTLENGSSANVLTLYGKSNSASDTLTVEPGSRCGWHP